MRRALELLRRGVEIGRSEHLKATVVARMAAAAAARQPAPSDHDVVVEWREGDTALVERAHVTEAQKEMFGALHLQLLRSRSLWDKVLLVAVVVEARATGRSAVVMQVGGAVFGWWPQMYFGMIAAKRAFPLRTDSASQFNLVLLENTPAIELPDVACSVSVCVSHMCRASVSVRAAALRRWLTCNLRPWVCCSTAWCGCRLCGCC